MTQTVKCHKKKVIRHYSFLCLNTNALSNVKFMHFNCYAVHHSLWTCIRNGLESSIASLLLDADKSGKIEAVRKVTKTDLCIKGLLEDKGKRKWICTRCCHHDYHWWKRKGAEKKAKLEFVSLQFYHEKWDILMVMGYNWNDHKSQVS